MAKKIASQLGTILVVLLVVLFCTHGITFRKPQSDTSTVPPVTEPVPTATQPPTEGSDSVPPTEPEPVETLPLEIGPAPERYFEDALFIGDSRTVGLQEYGDFPGATFFATNGMSVFTIFDDEVDGNRLTSLMYQKKFGKIYIMLGINELIFSVDGSVEQYREVVKWLHSCQPDAIILIQASLRVTEERSNSDRTFNNTRIDDFNRQISQLADGEQIFYLDVNPLFDDGAGNLADKYTDDDIHVLGIYYQTWSQWIAENAAVRPTQ